MIVLHHVHVTRLDEDLLTIAHRLQQVAIILLLLYDLFFRAKILSLLSNLLLVDIVLTQLSQFLLKHEFVVLRSHELFNLFLTTLELEHDLSVTLLDCLTIVTLAGSTELKGFLSFFFGILPHSTLLIVVAFHASRQLTLFNFARLNSLVHNARLMSPVHAQMLAQGLVPASDFFNTR